MNREKTREIAKEIICEDIKIEVHDSKESNFSFYKPQHQGDYWVVEINRNCLHNIVDIDGDYSTFKKEWKSLISR